jgi:hypothetical protein
MVFWSERKLFSMFGVTLEEQQMFTKDRWPRKKYMGVWRWELVLMSMIKHRFAASVIR